MISFFDQIKEKINKKSAQTPNGHVEAPNLQH